MRFLKYYIPPIQLIPGHCPYTAGRSPDSSWVETLIPARKTRTSLQGYRRMFIKLSDYCVCRCEEMERRLSASCAGLLEIDYRQTEKLSDYERSRPLCNNDYYRMTYGSKIQYLHRTVRDFFENPILYTEIKQSASIDGFNEHLALLRAWVLRADFCRRRICQSR